MKTTILKITLILTLLTAIGTGCEKNTDELEWVSNITLYDKPLSVIQFYIRGKWQLDYGKGGINARNIQYYDSVFWKFPSGNEVVVYENGEELFDSDMSWYKEPGTYTDGKDTYVMKFLDQQQVPWNYIVDGIYNDSLVIHDFSSDAMFYHFSKAE